MPETPPRKPIEPDPAGFGPEAPSFLKDFLLLDLETRGDRIYHAGAVLGELVFEARGEPDSAHVATGLDRMAAGARGLLGHNLLDHDLPILSRIHPRLKLLEKPVIDTLFLSPLAFPENPYHRLVKDYKLVRESLNDPVGDARLALSVFLDQWGSFGRMSADGHQDILSFYRFCFESAGAPAASPWTGTAFVFASLGSRAIDRDRAATIMEHHLGSRVCTSAFHEHLAPALDDPEIRVSLAYILAWLRVAGSNSVIPPWVRRRFPPVGRLLHLLRATPCADDRCDWCRENFHPSAQLQRYFGFPSFRPRPALEDGTSLQEAIVTAGMSSDPLLAILPTGGGKSLCYQLPALSRYYRLGTLTVVISPLQALMKDQVDNLSHKTGTPYAAAINGLLTPPERGEVLERVRLGDVAILYVAPEQLRNRSFRETITQRQIGAWVFDEAHCLSKWGHDFRPDYLYAGRFIREYSREQGIPVPPVACFTATAKGDVKAEIVDYFRRELGHELTLFEGGVERENLKFEVRETRKAEKFAAVHEAVADHLAAHLHGGAIVYTATRRRAEDLAEYLTLQGLRCGVFHGGLNPAEKRIVQESFLAGDLQVISATNAFGMGIDKGDVRLVLHMDIPGSLESYLQEAGRAGRDLNDADCVLLYDESDVETQFKLGAMSKLSQRDIAQILRGIRRAAKGRSDEIVITAGQILRDDEVDTSFDLDDLQAETKVKTAVAWLERLSFLERNENHTRVFQGKPLVASMDEARERISRLNLSSHQRRHWLSILSAMMNARGDQGLDADRLAELAGIPEPKNEGDNSPPRQESASQSVIRALHGMAEAGLLNKGLLLTAYVRHKVKNPSRQILKEISDLEEAMLRVLREAAPDAEEIGWSTLSLRMLNQKLREQGFESNPENLRGLLKALSLDGKGLAGSHGSISYRHVGQDLLRVKLLRSWEALVETSKRRRTIAKLLLDALLSNIDPNEPPSAELLVSFSTDDLAKALRSHLYLSEIKDPLGAIDRGLLYLHEQKVLMLQQGLAVFRQAMTIRLAPEARKRKYSRADYEPLDQHYQERVFQVHVMDEYARLGLKAIGDALELVLAYFRLPRAAFIRRYFPGRKDILARATGEDSYRRIVDELGNPVQMQVVSSSEDTNALVVAGPGSGKTRLVIHRCAYLIRVLRVPAEAILVVCFNHGAAISLRKRLFELLGEDARGIIVQTYHGIAMRITGTSFADMAERSSGDELPFDRLIPDAVRLLKGETQLPGIASDEVRDRLLSSFRHVLVDEYQDIDAKQYELISALAGRTENDPDARLSILAVGDDDQNIYSFRGANVQFIHKFQQDYAARIHYLVENYRSARHIIQAANVLIAGNRDRMKTDHPICVDGRREDEPPGGRWEGIDPLTRGRVQILVVPDVAEQASGLLSEWKRMRELDRDLKWSHIAVLARTRENLEVIRSVCEHFEIPVAWGLNREKSPALHRVREVDRFLAFLKERREELHRASSLERSLQEMAGGGNPWWKILEDLLGAWRAESGDCELPVSQVIEWLYENLAERRREQRLGDGVFLSTIHGAKGMEFPHVFLLDGDWKKTKNVKDLEEERRILYVAMTRARETLSIFRREDASNPHLEPFEGDFLVERRPEGVAELSRGVLSLRHELLGMKDIDLGFAGRLHPANPIHGRLSSLGPGMNLTAGREGASVQLLDDSGHQVAQLSKSASESWIPLLDRLVHIRIVAMIQRSRADESEPYKEHCRGDRWEVPWIEMVYRIDRDTSGSGPPNATS